MYVGYIFVRSDFCGRMILNSGCWRSMISSSNIRRFRDPFAPTPRLPVNSEFMESRYRLDLYGCCHAHSNASASCLLVKPVTKQTHTHLFPLCFLVRFAPPFIFLLCCRTRRLGSTVKPIYDRFVPKLLRMYT